MTSSLWRLADSVQERAGFHAYLECALNEIRFVLEKVDVQALEELLLPVILRSNRIVTHGAGRVGYACQGFAMRLAHLGFRAWALGDSNVPSIGPGDLVLIASGSGETQSVVGIGSLAKKFGAHVAVVTGNPNSTLGTLADTVVLLPAPSKAVSLEGMTSIQPMTTLNEQCLQIFFDMLCLLLRDRTQQANSDLSARHANLE